MTDDERIRLGTLHIQMYRERRISTGEFFERMREIGLTNEQITIIALQMVVGGLK